MAEAEAVMNFGAHYAMLQQRLKPMRCTTDVKFGGLSPTIFPFGIAEGHD